MYYREDILKSFLNGIKGVWKFKILFAVLLLIEMITSFFIEDSVPIVQNSHFIISSIIPAIFIFLMCCKYSITDSKSIHEYDDVNDDKTETSAFSDSQDEMK